MRLGVDAQRDRVVRIPFHHPLEPVAQPDYVEPFQPRANRRRADHAVDAGRRPAAHQNR
jgi:hypothetical protein